MKVLIFAWGSRGDVQPYLALAHALNEAGHDATLAATVTHTALAAEYGVRFFPRDDAQLKLLERPDVREVMQLEASKVLGEQTKAQAKEFKAKVKQVMANVVPLLKEQFVPMLDEQLKAAQEIRPDVIVVSHATQEYGHFVAEAVGVPYLVAELYPFYQPSWHYPSMPFQRKSMPRPLNRLSHLLPKLIIPMKKKADRWREETLGLPRRRGRFNRLRTADGQPVSMLHMFSRHLFPPAPDWPASVHNTGFSYLPTPSGYEPPEELVRFLAAGEPPVAIGFGSHSNPDPRKTGRMVTEAVTAAGVRAVVIKGGGGIEVTDPTDKMIMVDGANFAWLTPQLAGMVHGGGVGVTHDALLGGIPSLACPLFGEAAMWADRTKRAGAGLEPVWQAKLTTPELTTALRKLATDADLAAGAAEMHRKILAEPGHPLAIEVIERTAAKAPVTA